MNVIFFPRKDFDVEICNHRFGHKMTYVEHTDTIQEPSATNVLTKALAHGIRVGANIGTLYQPLPFSQYVLDRVADGTLRFDCYFKPKNTSDLSQLYTEAEFNTAYEAEKNWFKAITNRFPSVLAYGYGHTGYSEYAKKYFLAGRNSWFDLNVNEYGKSFDGVYLGNPQREYSLSNFISHDVTYRWYDQSLTIGVSAALTNLSLAIDTAYANGGLITNFTHWHDISNIADYETYFQMLSDKNTNNDIHFCSYGESIEYLVFRSMVSKAVAYVPKLKPNELIITLESLNGFNINSRVLNTPLSVKINLSGTNLSGKQIKCVGGLVYSQTGDIVIIEIPYSLYPSVNLKEI